jgi:hypothetical protein
MTRVEVAGWVASLESRVANWNNDNSAQTVTAMPMQAIPADLNAADWANS